MQSRDEWRAQRLLRYRTMDFPYLLDSQLLGGLSYDRIEAWLQNFRDTPEAEYHAARILAHTVYYPTTFVQQLYRKAFQDRIAWPVIRALAKDSYEDRDAFRQAVEDFMRGVLVVPLMDDGRPSESANAVTRLIKQEGLVDDNQICYPEKLLLELPGFHTVAIVDDHIGSGQQVFDFWRRPRPFKTLAGTLETTSMADVAARNPDKAFYCVVFAGVKDSVAQLNADLKPLSVVCPELLDERHKVFGPQSDLWHDAEEQLRARTCLEAFCTSKGVQIDGYRGMTYAYASQLGTPDWAMPLLRHKGTSWNQLLA